MDSVDFMPQPLPQQKELSPFQLLQDIEMLFMAEYRGKGSSIRIDIAFTQRIQNGKGSK